MDWASGDYTRVYADTFFVPEETHDEGIYLIEKDGEPHRLRCDAGGYADEDYGGGGYGSDDETHFDENEKFAHKAAAKKPAAREASSKATRAPKAGAVPRGRTWTIPASSELDNTPRTIPASSELDNTPRPTTREGFYGNIISSRRGNHAVFNVAWDERPPHFPLTPPPELRPPGGGNSPGLAFPLSPPAGPHLDRVEGFSGGGKGSAEQFLQGWGPILLFVLVVLLAMSLAAVGKAILSIERSFRELTEMLAKMRGPAPIVAWPVAAPPVAAPPAAAPPAAAPPAAALPGAA